jgi:hypothetical protein
MAAPGRAPTLRLGELTGVWAAIYRRRDQLEADAVEQVLAAWRHLAADVDLTPVMTALRQQLATVEAAPSPQQDRRRHVRQVTAAAVLAQLTTLTGRTAWPGLVAAITAALRRSRTAGAAAGHAVVDQQDDLPDEIDSGDGEGDDGDSGDDDGGGDPDEDLASAYTVTATALRGTAQTIARALLTAAEQGDDEQAMQDQADAATHDGSAWSLAATIAAGAAFTDGLVATYRDRGTQLLDFISVGDGHVCQTCSNAEDRSPWPASSAPRPPLHGHCRCTVQPST